MLREDEINRRAATAHARRVHAARFNKVTTLEGFDFSYNPEVPAAVIRDLAALGFVAAGELVILYGPAMDNAAAVVAEPAPRVYGSPALVDHLESQNVLIIFSL